MDKPNLLHHPEKCYRGVEDCYPWICICPTGWPKTAVALAKDRQLAREQRKTNLLLTAASDPAFTPGYANRHGAFSDSLRGALGLQNLTQPYADKLSLVCPVTLDPHSNANYCRYCSSTDSRQQSIYPGD